MIEAGREDGQVAAELPRVQPAEEVVDTLAELFGHVKAHFERIVEPYNLPLPCAKALRLIDGSISMKQLGSRIHCDGSFVTYIADTLEERGLARREIDRDDRRIKNLVLTRKGAELRSRLMRELFDDFPGLRNLDAGEQEAFLMLLHKMVAAEAGRLPEGSPDCAA